MNVSAPCASWLNSGPRSDSGLCGLFLVRSIPEELAWFHEVRSRGGGVAFCIQVSVLHQGKSRTLEYLSVKGLTHTHTHTHTTICTLKSGIHTLNHLHIKAVSKVLPSLHPWCLLSGRSWWPSWSPLCQNENNNNRLLGYHIMFGE